MFQSILNLSPIALAILGGLFAFLFTAMGSGIVFFFQNVSKKIMDYMISLSAGIMLAASFFSLLNPAIEISNEIKQSVFFIILGFIGGGLFVFLCNLFFSYFTIDSEEKISLKKCMLLFTSITLHNIPEGLAIGVAFGSILYGNPLISALSLTFGIAVQNYPEGAAISLPMKREGFSSMNSFLFGVISGLVEPISAIIGALLVLKINVILPTILSFAAGAMLYVTSLELIPECLQNKNKDLMAFILLIGFAFMMILEILLG